MRILGDVHVFCPSFLAQAFSSLAEAAIESIEVPEGETPETYCLSSFFEPIVQKLLETTDRNDGAQHNLRSAAYEALMELIKNSPKVPHLQLMLP